jgi:hypothetical protein
MFERFSRAWERLERLPLLLRGPACGAALVWLLIGFKGGFIGLPIVVIGILLTSGSPGADLATLGTVFGLATLGGAAGGLAYDIVGRSLRSAPMGDYLAGLVTVAPYVAFVVVIIRATENQPLLGAPDTAEIISFVFCTLLFGIVFGHSFLKDQ